MKLIFVFLVVILLLLTACASKYPQGEVDTFAKCLSENEVVMYGTFWCPHCAKVKKMFGSSFKYVTYVECDPRGDDEQSEFCLEKGIESYATFEFNNDPDSWLVGEPSFEELSEKSGCPMPVREE